MTILLISSNSISHYGYITGILMFRESCNFFLKKLKIYNIIFTKLKYVFYMKKLRHPNLILLKVFVYYSSDINFFS